MNRILWDFLKRWKWLVAVLVCVQFAVTPSMLKGNGFFVLSQILFLAGPWALLIDRGRGVFRVHHQTPVSRRELSLGAWLIAVPIPVVLLFVVSLASAAFWMSLRALPANCVERILFFGVEAFLFLGFIAFGSSCWNQSGRSKITDGLKKAVSFIAMLSCFLLFGKLPHQVADCGPLHVLGAAIFLLFTILGFVRRENTLISIGTWRPGVSGNLAAMVSGKTGGFSLERRASGGIPFLVSRACLRSAAMLGLLLVMLGAMDFLVGARIGVLKPLFVKGNSPSGLVNPGLIMFFLMPVVPGMLPALQIKSLRTLPFGSSKVVALLIGLPLVLSAGLVAVLYGIGTVLFGRVDLGPLLGGTCLATTMVMVAIPVALRWGITGKSYTALLALLIAFTAGPSLIHYLFGLSFTIEAWVAMVAASVVGAYFLTRHIVVHSSFPYRGPIMRLPGSRNRL